MGSTCCKAPNKINVQKNTEQIQGTGTVPKSTEQIQFTETVQKSKEKIQDTDKIKVYYWEKDQHNYGHVSLQLSGGTHISFWPSKPVNSTGIGFTLFAPFEWVEPIQDMTLEKDIEYEGRNPDDTIEIPVGDYISEIKIKQWWNGFKERNKYNAVRLNCATVVWKALSFGGALNYIKDPQHWWYDPESVRIIAYAILDGIKTRKEQNVNAKLPPVPKFASDNKKRADAEGSIQEIDMNIVVKKKIS